MPLRNEWALARARLQSEAPISDDVDLIELQKQAAAYVCEAKGWSASNELVSTIDAVARRYSEHVIRKKHMNAKRAADRSQPQQPLRHAQR